MPHRPFRRLLRGFGAAALVLAACVPGPGTCRLPALRGRVVDTDTGAPIAAATVIEWWRGAGVGGGPQPVYHTRFAVSDDAGRFAFPDERAPDPRMWALRVYEPAYGFVHPAYGLVRGAARRDAEGVLVLSSSLADAAARRLDLEALCTTPPREEWERVLAGRVCAPRGGRPPARGR
jgi:hypothetical protein